MYVSVNVCIDVYNLYACIVRLPVPLCIHDGFSMHAFILLLTFIS